MRPILLFSIILFSLGSCGDSSGAEPGVTSPPTPPEVVDPNVPQPDPKSKVLYNGITLPSTWPPFSSSSSNIYTGMSPFYLQAQGKPTAINIELGRQLFVDDFLVDHTNLTRTWHSAEYSPSNPVLTAEESWEMIGSNGAGCAAPFSDGVWYDEADGKFKMWYMAGSNGSGSDNPTTCYAESNDGINWTRPKLGIVQGTNIVMTGKNRDSNTIWIDKSTTDKAQRYKMFTIYGGAGNWRYHYSTSADGKRWMEYAASEPVDDRSTAFHNPFRGVWVLSARRNVRIDADNLIRAREYNQLVDIRSEIRMVKKDLNKFWFGPWLDKEPKHTNLNYRASKSAIYNMDAIGYESLMLGTFSVWSGPENDVCSRDGILKQNQLLMGYSRDGWNWHRGDFTPFCAVSQNQNDWNWGNIQSAVGSPIIVGDKLYFYMSGRTIKGGAQVTSTGLATLRRDGFASMDGTGTLTTEKLKFKGEYLFVNAVGGLKVEVLDDAGNVILGYSKDDCTPFSGNSTKTKIAWGSKSSLKELEGRTVRIKFYLTSGELYSFWVSKWESGQSNGHTAGGGIGLSSTGWDIPLLK